MHSRLPLAKLGQVGPGRLRPIGSRCLGGLNNKSSPVQTVRPITSSVPRLRAPGAAWKVHTPDFLHSHLPSSPHHRRLSIWPILSLRSEASPIQERRQIYPLLCRTSPESRRL